MADASKSQIGSTFTLTSRININKKVPSVKLFSLLYRPSCKGG